METTMEKRFDQAVDQMWEEMQPKAIEVEDPYLKFDFNTLNDAWASLETSLLDFGGIERFIDHAMEEIKGTPEHDELASIYDSITDLEAEVIKIKTKLKNEASKAFDRRWPA